LVEILLVVTIIVILASLAIPRLVGRGKQARSQAAMADIRGGVAAGLDLFELDNGAYPASLADLQTKPQEAANWQGPYLKKSPKDPWGHEYVYKHPGIHNTESYDLSSVGPDGVEGSEDDVTNWEEARTDAANQQ
jgi:general secretion pathway protein G